MAGPLYFFPGNWGSILTDSAIKQRINECDLGDILGDASRIDLVLTNGPDNGPGLLVVVRVEPPAKMPDIAYDLSNQSWVHIKPKGYWIGIQNSSKPTPIDLQRNGHLLQDYTIKLTDGNDWAIMTVNPFNRRGSMPRVGKMDENCEWTWSSHPRFDALAKKYEKIFAGEKDTLGGWADLAVETLAVNYRLNKYLAMVLELLEADLCNRIFDLAMDFPEFQAHEEAKKRGIERSEISVTSYGELIPPASQITEQPISMPAA